MLIVEILAVEAQDILVVQLKRYHSLKQKKKVAQSKFHLLVAIDFGSDLLSEWGATLRHLNEASETLPTLHYSNTTEQKSLEF